MKKTAQAYDKTKWPDYDAYQKRRNDKAVELARKLVEGHYKKQHAWGLKFDNGRFANSQDKIDDAMTHHAIIRGGKNILRQRRGVCHDLAAARLKLLGDNGIKARRLFVDYGDTPAMDGDHNLGHSMVYFNGDDGKLHIASPAMRDRPRKNFGSFDDLNDAVIQYIAALKDSKKLTDDEFVEIHDTTDVPFKDIETWDNYRKKALKGKLLFRQKKAGARYLSGLTKLAASRWKLYRNPRVGLLKRIGQNIMESTDGVYGRFTPEQVLNANIYDQVSRGVVANARTAVSPGDIQKVLRGIDRISGSASESMASGTRKDILDAYRSIRSRPAGVDFSGKSVEDFKDALSKRNSEIRSILYKLDSIREKFGVGSDEYAILSRLMSANSDGRLYRGVSRIVNYPNAGIKNLRRNGISSAFGMESLIGGHYRGVAPNSDRALYAKANGRLVRDYTARNPSVGKESSLLNKYGLTYEDLVALLRKNGATDAVFKGTSRDTSLQDIIDTARNSHYGESWWSHNPAVSIGYAKDGGLVVLYPGKQGNLRKEIYKRFTNHQATPDRSVQRDVNKRITDGRSVSRSSGSSPMGNMFDYEVTLNADELERARPNSMRFNIYGTPHGRLPEMHGLQKDTTGWLYPLRFMPGSLSDVDPYLTVTNIKNPSQLAFRDPTVRTLSDIGLRRYTPFTK